MGAEPIPNVHFYESEKMMRIRLRSGTQFRGGALCGNGDAHTKVTSKPKLVTCPKCQEAINKNSMYYKYQ